MDEVLIKENNFAIQHKKSHNLYALKQRITTKCKRTLSRIILFSENYPSLFSILKLIIGLILIGIPSIIVGYLLFFTQSKKYIVLPFFASMSLYTAFLLLLFVFRSGDDCKVYGILIPSWDRINLFRLLNCFIFSTLIIWSFFFFEKYFIDLPVKKDMVAQIFSDAETSYQVFDKGSFLLRFMFIFTMWNQENRNNKELGFFEYEDDFLYDFRSMLCKFTTPTIVIGLFYLGKIIFFRTKNALIYSIINLIVLFECFYFEFCPIENESNDINKEYFVYNFKLYIEIIPLIVLLLLVLFLYIKVYIIGLYKRKLFSYRTRKINCATFFIVILSFLLVLIGISSLCVILIQSMIIKIDSKLSISFYDIFWRLFLGGLISIAIGSSFAFGHYFFKLFFGPIAYELCPAVLKNPHYLRCSNKKNYKKGGKVKRNTKYKKKIVIP